MTMVRAHRVAILAAFAFAAFAALPTVHAQSRAASGEPANPPKAKVVPPPKPIVVPKAATRAGKAEDTAKKPDGTKKGSTAETAPPKAKPVQAKSDPAAKGKATGTPSSGQKASAKKSSTPDQPKKGGDVRFMATPPAPRDAATEAAAATAEQAATVAPSRVPPPPGSPAFRGAMPPQNTAVPVPGAAAGVPGPPADASAVSVPPAPPADGLPVTPPADLPPTPQLFDPVPDPIGIQTPFGYFPLPYPPPNQERGQPEQLPVQSTFTIGKIVVKYGTDVRKRNRRIPTEEQLADAPVPLLVSEGVYYHVPQPRSEDPLRKAADPALPAGPSTEEPPAPAPEKKENGSADDKKKSGSAEDKKKKGGAADKQKKKEAKPKAATGQIVEFRPSETGRPRRISGQALQDVYDNIVRQVNQRGVIGVYVLTNLNPRNLTERWKDGKDVQVTVFVSEVLRARTIARRIPFKAGDISLINDDEAPDGVPVKDKKHLWIKDKSPVKPGAPIERAVLQDYLTRLNRFPGRRVDAAMNASGEPGKIILDYIIREQKPLFIYAQTSNTGTEATGIWRHRLGIEYKQLRNEDDILRLEYVTSDPSQFESAFASYEFALDKPDKVKARIYGIYGKYSAEDIGLGLQSFEGQNLTAGAALTWTPFYVSQFPIDFTLGGEWFNVTVENPGFPTGEGTFILPYFSIGTDRRTDVFSVAAHIEAQASFGGPDQEDLDALGRAQADGDFIIGKWDVGLSTYLEPIFYGKRWRDYARRDTPTTADLNEYDRLGGKATLGVEPNVWFQIKQRAEQKWQRGVRAHEISFSSRGQYAFSDARLVPQLELILGGFNTIRGYPEAFAAGDTGWFGSVEYRLHLARLLAPYEVLDAQKDMKTLLARKPSPPKPKVAGKKKGKAQPAEPAATQPVKLLSTTETTRAFNFRPPQAGTEPDWDLIFRIFGDAGETYNNNIQEQVEVDRSMLSVGAGLELQIFKPLYMTFRLDYGMVLSAVTDPLLLEPINSGDSRFHISGTIAW